MECKGLLIHCEVGEVTVHYYQQISIPSQTEFQPSITDMTDMNVGTVSFAMIENISHRFFIVRKKIQNNIEG